MIPELPESPTLSRQRRVTMGETNDEREGSRAAHPPPRLYPESPFPEAFCFLFFDRRSEGSCCRDIERGRWIYYIPMIA